MYHSFYRMTEKPFKISTDPRFLWLGEKHREALANLKYGLLDRNGFVVLTGDVGTGKTTLVNALVGALDDHVRVAKINHPSLDMAEFMVLVAKALDPAVQVSNKSDFLIFLNTYLQQSHADGKIVLLVIDEAHRLSVELLEEIRLLSNIERSGEKLLNIIFVGQDEIKPMLKEPHCRALRQRITSFYDIPALSQEETRQYMDYRLKVSGTTEPLFTSSAIGKIHVLSRGIPRLINILCDRALLTGYVKERRVINGEIIDECGVELDMGAKNKADAQKGFLPTVLSFGSKLSAQINHMAAALMKRLSKVTEKIDEQRDSAAAWIYSSARGCLSAFQDISGHYTRKYKVNLSSLAVRVGIAAMLLALTIGVFLLSKDRGEPSIAATQDEKTDRPRQIHSEKSVPAQTVSWDPTQFERYSTIATPPPLARDDSAAGRSASRQERIAEVQPSTALAMQANVAKAKTALEQGDFQRALELLEAIPAGAASEDAESVGLYAKALIGQAGRIMETSPLEAEALWNKAVEVAPNMPDPYLMLGKHYIRIKEYSKAVDAYQKAIRLDPAASDAFFNLGFVYATTGKFEAAEEAFKRVVALRPTYLGKSLFNLAVVQQKLGKNEESIANLETVVALGPKNAKALAYLNQLRQTSGGQETGQIR